MLQCREYRNSIAKLARCGGIHNHLNKCNQDIMKSMGLLAARATDLEETFQPQGVANLMWALATLGLEPGAELGMAMSRRAVMTAGEFKPQGVANLIRSLTVFSVISGIGFSVFVQHFFAHLVYSLPLLCALGLCFSSDNVPGDREDVLLCELHQVELLCLKLLPKFEERWSGCGFLLSLFLFPYLRLIHFHSSR